MGRCHAGAKVGMGHRVDSVISEGFFQPQRSRIQRFETSSTWSWEGQHRPAVRAGEMGQLKPSQLLGSSTETQRRGPPVPPSPRVWRTGSPQEATAAPVEPGWGLGKPRGALGTGTWGAGSARLRGGMCTRGRGKGGRSSVVFTLSWDTIQEAASTIQAEQQEEYPGGKSKISQPTAQGRCGASVVGSFQHKLQGTHQE